MGEEFIRRAAAHDVAARVAYKGVSLREAMRQVVWESFSEGDGGFVGVDADCNLVWDFNRWVDTLHRAVSCSLSARPPAAAC